MQSQTAVATDFRYRLEFVYDWMGRRIQKVSKTWDTMTSAYNSGTTLKFLYDGWNIVSELDGSNNQLRVYLWGPDLSGSLTGAGGVGGLLSMFDFGTWKYQFYAYDGNGNVSALVNQDGTTTARYDYGPFGELVRSSGALAKANPFRFSTKYQDDESGLSYYGYRFYDPLAGRWISRDPANEEAGKNIVSFDQNDLLNFSDFLGLWASRLSFKVHQYAIDDALRSVKEDLRDVLKERQGTSGVDGWQAGSFSYLHAMRNKATSETINNARAKAVAWVRHNLTLARSHKAKKYDCLGQDSIVAMWFLGNAMHTIQDSTSPVHRGFQEWDAELEKDPVKFMQVHGFHEMFYSRFIDDASDDLYYATKGLYRAYEQKEEPRVSNRWFSPEFWTKLAPLLPRL